MSSPFVSSPVPPALPAAPRSDFPTWLPAMLVKELRQGLRTKGFVGAFIGFQVIMALSTLGTVLSSAFGNPTTRAVMGSTINGFFWVFLGVQVLLMTPIRAISSLQLELESRSLDLLVLTRLTAWRIVLGKWGSLLAQAFLLLIAMLPYGIVRYFMGSVDLVQDALRAAAMMSGCALLTAAGLAISGLPKVARILFPVVFFLSFQIVPPLFALGRRGAGPSLGAIFSTDPATLTLWWINGALVLGIFLVSAVRRIAPAAENHVLLSRGLALAAIVPAIALVLMKKSALAQGQLGFAGVLLGVMGAIELASMRWPMLAHWRPWAAGDAAWRWVGWFALPGWPSAFLFAVAAGLLMAVVAMPAAADPLRAAWLAVLAVSGLVFPAVVLSFFQGSGRAAGAFYGLIVGVLSLFAAMSAGVGNSIARFAGLISVTEVFPIAGFWITLFTATPATSLVFFSQAVVALAVLGVAWWQSRVYWQRVAALDAQVRSAEG